MSTLCTATHADQQADHKTEKSAHPAGLELVTPQPAGRGVVVHKDVRHTLALAAVHAAVGAGGGGLALRQAAVGVGLRYGALWCEAMLQAQWGGRAAAEGWPRGQGGG